MKKVGFEPTKYFNTIDLQSSAVDRLAIFSVKRNATKGT